jgi:hypothetical protein
MAQPESSRPATSSLVPLSEIQTNQRGRMSTNIGGSKAVVLLPVAAEAGAGASSQRGPPQGVTHGVSFLPRPFVKKTSGVKWTAQEDALLRTAVEQHGAKNWKNIAAQLRDRTEVQCLHRWQKVLKPSLVKGPWTAEEDRKVRARRGERGERSEREEEPDGRRDNDPLLLRASDLPCEASEKKSRRQRRARRPTRQRPPPCAPNDLLCC